MESSHGSTLPGSLGVFIHSYSHRLLALSNPYIARVSMPSCSHSNEARRRRLNKGVTAGWLYVLAADLNSLNVVKSAIFAALPLALCP